MMFPISYLVYSVNYFTCLLITYPHIISYRAKWVKVAGITYKKPCALLVGVEDESPQLAILQGIYVVDTNRVLFRVRQCVTEHFDSHHHAFIISNTSSYKLVHVQDLYNPQPVHVRTISSDGIVQQAVIMKYHIHSTLLA